MIRKAGLMATARHSGSHRHIVKTIIAFTVTAVLTLAACGEADEGSDATVTSRAQSASTTSPAAEDGDERMAEVIVDLAVAWNPEDGLSDGELADIAGAQQDVLHLLEGTSFSVIRLYEFTPQMALAVDDEGLKRLETSDLVASVAPNVLDPPTG